MKKINLVRLFFSLLLILLLNSCETYTPKKLEQKLSAICYDEADAFNDVNSFLMEKTDSCYLYRIGFSRTSDVRYASKLEYDFDKKDYSGKDIDDFLTIKEKNWLAHKLNESISYVCVLNSSIIFYNSHRHRDRKLKDMYLVYYSDFDELISLYPNVAFYSDVEEVKVRIDSNWFLILDENWGICNFFFTPKAPLCDDSFIN